eukprot:11866310-Heterocapsa_arctica.AAC.1
MALLGAMGRLSMARTPGSPGVAGVSSRSSLGGPCFSLRLGYGAPCQAPFRPPLLQRPMPSGSIFAMQGSLPTFSIPTA